MYTGADLYRIYARLINCTAFNVLIHPSASPYAAAAAPTSDIAL